MVAADKENAKRRRQFKQRSSELVRISTRSVKEISSDKDDRRVELARHRCYATCKTHSVDVAEMNVADNECGAAAPRGRQIGQLDGDALLPNVASIQNAVDGGRNRGSKDSAGNVRS